MIIDSHAHYINGAYRNPFRYLTRDEHGYVLIEDDRDQSLREAFQEGKAQDGSGQTADLGQAESRHQKVRKQQGIQQKEDAGLEEGTSESCVLIICIRVLQSTLLSDQQTPARSGYQNQTTALPL